MNRTWNLMMFAAALVALAGGSMTYLAVAEEAAAAEGQQKWEVHDMKRPKPPIITPGTFSTQDQPGKAPSDALVLFDGTDLSHWQAEGGGDPTWNVKSGYMEAAKKGMETKDKFGDLQIHAEWSEPEDIKGESQGRGNSGIYIMGRYEVQVLDSYKNETYADGQAGALYGQYPPLVNAMRPPGQWNVYDIVFHRPHFNDDGSVAKPATVTVFHNGVLVQDHSELKGTTAHHSPGKYEKHPDKEPIHLQWHGNPVRFRNFWIRQLEK
jgi:hypothetical protein